MENELSSRYYKRILSSGDEEDDDDRVRLNGRLSMLKLWLDLKASRSSYLLRLRSPSDFIYVPMPRFSLLGENRAWAWFSEGHPVINSGMSCFVILPAFWRLHESFAIVLFLIHLFHKDLYFAPAVHLEFLGCGSSWCSEL
jgi:hypothetical protein